MIEGVAELFGASAGAHVEAVDDEADGEGGEGHADDVAGVPRAFEAVDEDQFAEGFAGGALGLDEDLGIGFGSEEAAFDGVGGEIEFAGPVIGEDRQEVGVGDEGGEGPHERFIIGVGGVFTIRSQLRLGGEPETPHTIRTQFGAGWQRVQFEPMTSGRAL